MAKITASISTKKWVTLLETILVFGFIFNPWTKFPYTFIVIILTILLIVYLKDKTLSNIGFKSDYHLLKILGIALTLFLIFEPIYDFIIQPLVNKLVNDVPDYSAFEILNHNSSKYLKFISFMWISAAFGEEILFRGFLFRQFKILFPKFKYKQTTIVLLTSILFALPHVYLGASGVIMTFLFGLLFGGVYVKYNYNLWITIVLHGLVDSLFLTLAYTDNLEYFNIANNFLFGF